MNQLRTGTAIGLTWGFCRGFEHGLQLPWLTTLSRMTIPSDPLLQKMTAPLLAFLVTAIVLAAVWHFGRITNLVVETKRGSNVQV